MNYPHSLIHHNLIRNDSDILDTIVQRDPSRLEVKEGGMTALFLSVQENNLEAVQHLLYMHQSYSVPIDQTHEEFNNKTAFHLAIDQGNQEIIQAFLAHDPSLINTPTLLSNTNLLIKIVQPILTRLGLNDVVDRALTIIAPPQFPNHPHIRTIFEIALKTIYIELMLRGIMTAQTQNINLRLNTQLGAQLLPVINQLTDYFLKACSLLRLADWFSHKFRGDRENFSNLHSHLMLSIFSSGIDCNVTLQDLAIRTLIAFSLGRLCPFPLPGLSTYHALCWLENQFLRNIVPRMLPNTGDTPLHIAIASASVDLDTVEQLLDQPEIRVNQVDINGITPLQAARQRVSRQITEMAVLTQDLDALMMMAAPQEEIAVVQERISDLQDQQLTLQEIILLLTEAGAEEGV